ncbi:DUF721 domain-containing protein [Candidatus Neptunochlamydia vexilliferae]|nr:DUF721 domain-containing protein [Candidatus Neptunochlamydia vexilliferae]
MKRTPRNYDGSKPTGKEVKELLPGMLAKLSAKCDYKPLQILEAWPEIVGERIGKMTRAVSFDEGVLRVQVKNSTLYSLLVEHEKRRLVTEFQKRFPAVRDIWFKIG